MCLFVKNMQTVIKLLFVLDKSFHEDYFDEVDDYINYSKCN